MHIYFKSVASHELHTPQHCLCSSYNKNTFCIKKIFILSRYININIINIKICML